MIEPQEDQGDKMDTFEIKTMNTTFYIEISNSEIPNWKEVISLLLQYFEREFSRFRINNELWFFNEAKKGAVLPVSPIFYDLLRNAEQYRVKTEGRFSPYILSTLIAHGYNQSFPFEYAKIEESPVTNYQQELEPLRFHDNYTITKNTDQKIDLGGIAKGYAVEAISKWLKKEARSRYGIVDGGGDIEVWSNGEKRWKIGIMDPFNDEKEIGSFSIGNGGIATSNIIYRSWWQGDRKKHHILDGRTGMPVQSQMVQATVITNKCLDAEIGAKICLMEEPSAIKDVLNHACKNFNFILVKSNKELEIGGSEINEFGSHF